MNQSRSFVPYLVAICAVLISALALVKAYQKPSIDDDTRRAIMTEVRRDFDRDLTRDLQPIAHDLGLRPEEAVDWRTIVQAAVKPLSKDK